MRKEELIQSCRALLSSRKLYLVSNREPYVHKPTSRGFVCEKQPGGVALAFDPVMQALGGTWVAWGSGDLDKKFVDHRNRIKVPPDNPKYTLRRIWLNPQEVENYYLGFSNKSLWPLAHNLSHHVIFKKKFWEFYKNINERFGWTILDEAPQDDSIIWINDYQLSLVPAILRRSLSRPTIVFFWHIPWPNPDAFEILPNKKSLLEGLLGSDLLGFHTDHFCNNFLTCVKKMLNAKIDFNENSISYKGHRTYVKSFPISIDYELFNQTASSKETQAAITRIRRDLNLSSMQVGLGVDRIDYTKGIIERLNALELFFERYHQYRKKFTFIQIAAPSRTKIKAYQQLRWEIMDKIYKINQKYQVDEWKPITLINRGLDQKKLSAYYRLADLCIISSLQDGMNLVAKEYIGSQVDETGVLLLSQFAGAFEEIDHSIPINPFYPDSSADSIKQALDMPSRERKRRMHTMRKHLRDHDIYKWTNDIFTQALKISDSKKAPKKLTLFRNLFRDESLDQSSMESFVSSPPAEPKGN